MKKSIKIISLVIALVMILSATCISASAGVAVAGNSAYKGSRNEESHSGKVLYLNSSNSMFKFGNALDTDFNTGGNINLLFDFCFKNETGSISMQNDNGNNFTISATGHSWAGSTANSSAYGSGVWHRAEIRLSNSRENASVTLVVDGIEKTTAESCFNSGYIGSGGNVSYGREIRFIGNEVYIDNIVFDWACKARYASWDVDGSVIGTDSGMTSFPFVGGEQFDYSVLQVVFDANGGSGTVPTTLSVVKDSTFKAPSATLTGPTQCDTFAGWNTRADGKGTTYAVGSDVKVTSPMYLYAKWNANHSPVTDPAVEAKCLVDGKTEGSHCSNCSTVLVAQQVIKAPGHTWDEGITTVFATCKNVGTKHFTCTKCSEGYKDEEIAKLPHTEVADKAVAPTCTEGGLTAGSHCSVCLVPIVAQEYIQPTGHNFVEGVCTVCKARDPEAYLPGDVTADGTVDNFDLIRLLKYFVDADVVVDDFALDTNGDKVVNAKDLVRLAKYLADPASVVLY